MNFFFITASRHDSDRVEVQVGFDGEVQADTKRYSFEVKTQLMFPKSLGLSDNFDKDTLRAQFQSHLRLHTHAGNPQNPTKLSRVKERLELLSHQLSEESLRFFALEIEAFLKYEIRTLKKILRPTVKVPVVEIRDLILSTEEIIGDYRKILEQRHLIGKSAKDFPFDSFDHDLLLLDEYISHLFVRVLGHLKLCVETRSELRDIQSLLPKISLLEAEHRQKTGYFLQSENNPAAVDEEEHYLRRTSLLKKYFQKILFVQAALYTRERQLLIPVYGLSAAIAATFAIAVQIYQMDRQTQALGISTIAFVSVAVFAYVIKDILKDYFRRFFYKQTAGYFPDYKVKLTYVHRNEKKSLGMVEEFLKLTRTQDLPAELQRVRYYSSEKDLEPEVEEDVVDFRKTFSLNLKSLELREHYHWGLREVLRIRLDRYTTSMDDATKRLHLLRPDGSIETHLGHRVYFLHLVVSINAITRSAEESPGSFKIFRIKMDKTGVLAVENFTKSLDELNEFDALTI